MGEHNNTNIWNNYMIKNIIFIIILIAIGATIAYQMGWLSSKGENVYEKTKESVVEKSEQVIDKTKDAIK
ncbi:MAG: hypothetical protein LJE83_10690 [Gammaproteobacteria bacterium]|nr:hypothetical protein [Gammaproteobacteria bacterium]